MCHICGKPYCTNPDFCVSAQPFCDQCEEDTRCAQKMDMQCVIYHFKSNKPTRLVNLGFGNNSNLEAIIEKIDELIGNQFNIPFEPVDTITVKWTAGGTQGHAPKADVVVSTQSGNTLSIISDGLYVSDANDGKVKTTLTDVPDYLIEKIVGGTDGIVSISVVPTTGSPQLLQIKPSIDLQCLANAFCDENDIAKNTLAACLFNAAFDIDNTPSVSLFLSGGLPNVLTAEVNISAATGNTLVELSDGLYVPESTSSVVNAQNGLNTSVTPGTVELGGLLIRQTTLTITDPLIINAFNIDDTQSLSDTVYSGIGATLKRTSAGFSQSVTQGSDGANVSNYWLDVSGASALGSGESTHSAVYGAFIKTGAGALTGGIPAGAVFLTAFADGGNIQHAACLRLKGPINPPAFFGGTFSGTVTNQYGLYIDSQAAAEGTITNQYAIYQVGATDISRFFGDVQNAGGGLEFTSDIRVKENINSFTKGLDIIEAISPRTFNYVYKKDKLVTGIIAQEIEDVLPEAVKKGSFSTPEGDKTFDDFRMVDQNVLFYTMLNAIKELSAKVKILENK